MEEQLETLEKEILQVNFSQEIDSNNHHFRLDLPGFSLFQETGSALRRTEDKEVTW